MSKDYSYIASKSVLDSDGFSTDYTWYKNADGTHVFVFGDSDIYHPEDGCFDHVCDTEREAQEWFDDYKGFEEELEEPSSLCDLIDAAEAIGLDTESESCECNKHIETDRDF